MSVAVARNAMATRFEIVIYGENEAALRAAGEEALDEIERLEEQLSLYRPTSEISRLNAQADSGPVRVEPGLFRLLQHAQQLARETQGAFDITVAPLMRCWGFLAGTGKLPDAESLAQARARVGMHRVALNEQDRTVHFTSPGVRLDLGAIGKGYAIERAAALLREAGITCAFLHGGTSTAYALGAPPDDLAWKVAVERPAVNLPAGAALAPVLDHRPADTAALIVRLKDESLSVSAVWGKAFEAEGKVYGHIIDPRTGAPAQGAWLAAVVLPSATESDALSTALLTVGCPGHDQIARLRPQMRTLVAGPSADRAALETRTRGFTLPAGW